MSNYLKADIIFSAIPRYSLLLFFALAVSFSKADNIYLMNAPGYNTAGQELIDVMTGLGHTVTVEINDFSTLPPAFTSACVDPVNGYHWLCFFGDYDFSPLSPQVSAFIADGGKVYYNYEVSCCTTSSAGAAAMVAAVTGLPIVENVNSYISASGSPTGGGFTANLSGCMNVIGNAYKGLDGLPVANQLQANASINGATPVYTDCPNFGYFFSGADIPGNTLNGSITGMGDINVWYDGSEPWSNSGLDPVNVDLVAYFFPNANTTCHLATPGCASVCPYENVLGPDVALCNNTPITLDATTAGVTYLWNDGSTGSTLPVSQAGTYWVDVSDGTVTCTDTIHITSVVVNAVASADVTICEGLSTPLSANGGTTYSWSPAATLDNSAAQSPVATPLATTTYTVTVTQNNCSDTDDVIVNVVPADITYTSFIEPAVCAMEGSILIDQVVGGQPPFHIELNAVPIAEQNTIDLPAGNYILHISDNVGCALTNTLTVADASYVPDFTTVKTDPFCNVLGSIEIGNVQNTNGSVDYYVNNVVQPGSLVANLTSGNYTVKITDSNGCTNQEVVVLTYSNGNVQADVVFEEPICLVPGSIQVSNVTNAQTPYVISLNGTPNLSGFYPGLGAGNYHVSIQDANGCLFDQDILLMLQMPQLQLALDTLPQLCETLGRLNAVNVIGGTSPYYITLDNLTFQSAGANIDTIDHYLSVTDANGCVALDTFSVGYVNHTHAMFYATPSLMHVPQEVVFTNDSENADTFQWELGNDNTSADEEPTQLYFEPGDIEVTLIAIDSENGCVDSIKSILTILPANEIFIPNTFTPDNDGINDVFMVKGQNIALKDFNLQVFNRYGEVVWQANEPTDVWTGSHQGGEFYVPDGAYPFHLKYRYTDSVEPIILDGHITVLR